MSDSVGDKSASHAPQDAASDQASPEATPSLLQTVFSVLAAFFGVQNRRNYERDFKKGRPGVFIAVGLFVTAIFALTLILIVRVVLHQAGM